MKGRVPRPSSNAVVYALCDARESHPIRRVRYIGQTVRPLARRLAIHWQTARAGLTDHRAAWMRHVAAQGGDVLIVELVRVLVSDVYATERQYIAMARAIGCDLTNTTDGGEGVVGYVVSPATRAKQRAAARSRRPPSAETRARMRASLRRTYSRPEMREHMRRIVSGRTRSPETRAKMSVARQGEGNGMARLTWPIVLELRQRYANGERQAALARAYGVSPSRVHYVVRNKGWVAA